MIAALDTNVLLDILFDDQNFAEESRNTLEDLSEEHFFIVSPEVYSELMAAFKNVSDNPREELDNFLNEKSISLREHSQDSLELAGIKWNEYTNTDSVRCPSCGQTKEIECSCGEQIKWRNHIITDFMIGGHAQYQADKLVTRDNGYFHNYFDIEIIDPGE